VQDWIKSREYVDDIGLDENGASGADKPGSEAESAKRASQQRWVRAPNDSTLRNTPCPICQEKFESTWSEEAQDWIWQDAVNVGNRVYHASCYAEVTKDGTVPRAGTPVGRTGTPDSVLGKRKAEVRLPLSLSGPQPGPPFGFVLANFEPAAGNS
jgi:pre-mRNA cleavage complex 2 protein Pcf11